MANRPRDIGIVQRSLSVVHTEINKFVGVVLDVAIKISKAQYPGYVEIERHHLQCIKQTDLN
jgi:hypothetical protein